MIAQMRGWPVELKMLQSQSFVFSIARLDAAVDALQLSVQFEAGSFLSLIA